MTLSNLTKKEKVDLKIKNGLKVVESGEFLKGQIENNSILIDLMDYIKFEKKPQYFHSCDGHWSETGNLFAADIFLKYYNSN